MTGRTHRPGSSSRRHVPSMAWAQSYVWSCNHNKQHDRNSRTCTCICSGLWCFGRCTRDRKKDRHLRSSRVTGQCYHEVHHRICCGPCISQQASSIEASNYHGRRDADCPTLDSWARLRSILPEGHHMVSTGDPGPGTFVPFRSRSTKAISTFKGFETADLSFLPSLPLFGTNRCGTSGGAATP